MIAWTTNHSLALVARPCMFEAQRPPTLAVWATLSVRLGLFLSLSTPFVPTLGTSLPSGRRLLNSY